MRKEKVIEQKLRTSVKQRLKNIKKSLKSTEKIKIESHSMDIIKKQKKAEKRQGWWNQ